MDDWQWAFVGLGIWAFAALPLALVIGRVIRLGSHEPHLREFPIATLARRARQR
jgi:hypothetical protein